MIIYDATVPDFVELSKSPDKLATVIKGNLKNKFGISIGDSEYRSWTISLPSIAKILSTNNKDCRRVLCEFNIPTCKKRIDFIILGKDENNYPSAWIIELKQWTNVDEISWNQFRIRGKYIDTHPSYQARDYKLRLDHEMGLSQNVKIEASSFLHNLNDSNSPLFKNSYYDILKAAALYYFSTQNILSAQIDQHTKIRDGLESFNLFAQAKWSPTKTFMELAKEDFDSINLVGSQKVIYDRIFDFIKSWTKNKKMTFLISGDPGSGKTIIAFKLAILILKDLEMNIQLMVPGQELREAFKTQMKKKHLTSIIGGAKLRTGVDAAIIDEGHKAIARDTGKINYERNYQGLNFAIVLVDDDQVINKKGMTKEEIKQIASNAGHEVHEFEVEENFRNNGERSLIDWINWVFYKRETSSGEFKYIQEKYVNKNQNYKLYGYKEVDEFTKNYFEAINANNKSTRMTSLWNEDYYVGLADLNGDLPLTISIGLHFFAWNPNKEWWDRLKPEVKSTYNKKVKKFVEKRESFLVEEINPHYIAYFNHIQGFEFENIFVYIPKVFTYVNDEIIFHRDRLEKAVKSSQTWSPSAKIENLKGETSYELNKKYFLNRIKVMLTRGTKSTHVFAEDKALNEYILNSIES